MKLCLISLHVVVTVVLVVTGWITLGSSIKLDPVLFTNNRVYALINQHAGNYLTAGENGIPYRSSDRGMHSVDQLWKVQAISKEGFMLVPVNGEPPLKILWRPVYLGYGKYQLRNVDGDTCLEALNRKNIETPCSKENMHQEWFPTLIKDLPTTTTTTPLPHEDD